MQKMAFKAVPNRRFHKGNDFQKFVAN